MNQEKYLGGKFTRFTLAVQRVLNVSVNTGFFCLRAKTALDKCRALLVEKSADPVAFSLSGIGHFNHSVLYAKICNDNNLKRLKQIAGRSTEMCVCKIVRVVLHLSLL